MSTAFPCATRSKAASRTGERNTETATLRSPDSSREQRLRLDVPENAQHDSSAFGHEGGALTPEAYTDGDNDSSDDDRRGLLKTPAPGAETRVSNRLRDSCRWLSTHNSFRAQARLLGKDAAKPHKLLATPTANTCGTTIGTDRARAGRVAPQGVTLLGKMMTPAPGGEAIHLGRHNIRGGTTDRCHRVKDSFKAWGRALNTPANAPAVAAIQAAASAALAQSPQAALSAVFASPHKRALARAQHSNININLNNDDKKACGFPVVGQNARKAVTKLEGTSAPLAPPKAVPTKKRKMSSPRGTLPLSPWSRRPSSTAHASGGGGGSLSSSSSWLEAAWTAAAAAATERDRETAAVATAVVNKGESAEKRPRTRPRVASKATGNARALDLSCAEDIDVDEVMNAGGEVRTPICRFLLPCWPEGVEGYEEVGGWRRLGAPAAEEGSQGK